MTKHTEVEWLCEPPPGSGLPEVMIAAPSKASALIRLGWELRELGHTLYPDSRITAATSYRITRHRA
jgi:hypothetical protein